MSGHVEHLIQLRHASSYPSVQLTNTNLTTTSLAPYAAHNNVFIYVSIYLCIYLFKYLFNFVFKYLIVYLFK